MNRVGQELFARTGFTQQQHGAGGLRRTSGLPFDLNGGRTCPYKTRKSIPGLALTIALTDALAIALAIALAGQLAPGIIQIAL